MREVLEHLTADRNGSRRAHQIPNGIERVDTNVDQRAAAGTFLFRKPIANSNRNAARTNESGFHEIDFAKPPFVHHRLGRAHHRAETTLPAEKVNEVSLLCFVPQRFHFRRVHRRRLFAQDMFAGLERGKGRGKMQKIREANDYRINMSILQKLMVIAETFFGSVTFLKRNPPFIIEIGTGIKICDRARTTRFRVHLSRPAHADDSEIHFFMSILRL